ncbi:hypothetical protein [uncultured Sphingomonas sp.]|uniref:hypothetical protein n=1 Tax=uncultured Sphingomonas sp. TaxID=158754 RepID=UPI0035CA62FF
MAEDHRRDRLAAALRANLKRRKRPGPGDAPGGGEPDIVGTDGPADRTGGTRR